MRFLPLVALFACTPPGAQVEREAIVGGVTDTGDPAVVLVIIGDPNGGYIYMCTGEVVSPHVILTAGHCTSERGPYNIYLGHDLDRMRPSDLYKATNHPHPQYSQRVVDNYDIGVLVLDNPVPGSITPLPMNKDVDPGTLVGQDVRLVGYGSTGSLDPNDTSSGLKRQTTTTLSRVSSRLLEFSDSRHNTCEGDSGGPALMMLNGVETIVGVTSFGEQSPGYCDGHGFDSRVDLYAADFVQPFIDMYDPPKPGDPGSVGYACNDHPQCASRICANAGSNGYCTAGCDPALADSCPAGMQCADKGGGVLLCEKIQPVSSGCDVGGHAPNGGLWFMLLALAGLVRRRLSN